MSPVIFVAADLTDEEVGRYSGFKVVKKPLIEKINIKKQTNAMIPFIKLSSFNRHH